MMPTDTVVVVNPGAAGGRVGRVWDELRHVPALAAARIVHAADPATARAEIAATVVDGAARILALGGDGSLHLIANIVLELGRGAEVAIGIVPVGTGGDLARALGVTRDPRTALERALAAHPRPLDAIEVVTDDGRRRYVLNVASAGISGVVDEAVNARPDRGPAAYLAATLGAIWRYRNRPCRVSVDGQPWFEGEVFLVAVANGTSFGRGMRVAPEARPDDGEADIVLIEPIPRWRLVFQMPRIYRGTHLADRHRVRWRRGREVRFEPLAPFPPFDLDGEVFAAAAARFAVLPAALRVLV